MVDPVTQYIDCKSIYYNIAACIVSSAADVLWMSVVRRVRGVGGVCEMCMCLAGCGVCREGGEWVWRLGLGFTNPMGTGEMLDVWLCFDCGGVVGVGGEWVGAWTMVWRGGMVLCLYELWVWILCVDGGPRYLCIVLGGYPRTWSAPSVQSCCTLWISAS